MSDNLIKNKSFAFVLSIIELYKKFKIENEFVISKQLLRSGTSIGTNIEERSHAQNKVDFISKLSFSLKENCESLYWLELLKKSELTKINLDNYVKDSNKIISILTKIITTTKKNIIKK